MITQPISKMIDESVVVQFTGSTAVKQGMGFCYDVDRGTATEAEETRFRYVEVPSITNNNEFAGVAAHDYPAKKGGQPIHIFPPGSKCLGAIGQDVTIGDRVTCCISGDPGRFLGVGPLGAGSAVVRQTVTALSDTFMDGSASLDAAGTTLTLTGIGTAVQTLTQPRVVILGGGPLACTPGNYTPTFVTADSVLLDSAASAAAVTAVFGYVIDGNPKAMMELEAGPCQSGLTQYVAARANAAASPTVTPSGKTFLLGPYTIATGNSTGTLADGSFRAPKKIFECMGSMTTNDYDITVTTGRAIHAAVSLNDPTVTLAGMVFDGTSDIAVLDWTGSAWKLTDYKGTVSAAV